MIDLIIGFIEIGIGVMLIEFNYMFNLGISLLMVGSFYIGKRILSRKGKIVMNEEERKAIGQCKLLLAGDIYLHIIDEDDGGTAYTGTVNKEYNKDLETVLNLIEKQQKVANLQEKTIQLMADYIKDIDDCINSEFNSSEFMGYNVQEIIEYFRNKAKESE